ncbi:MAG: glycosyltransferase family 4 protein [Rhodospirillaceae bacterium]|nr:glycosyltransferase family 4 protein [Rhodospirillaceae bacterium]
MSISSAMLDVSVARAFAKFSARHMPLQADLFVGWSGASLEAIPVARARGMKVIIERGSTHIEDQTKTLSRVFAAQGLKFNDTSKIMIERELAEYDAADAICVPSNFAAETFIARGVPGEKLIVNAYGVDLSKFEPSPTPQTATKPRIVFVGRVGLRKGVAELLEAFSTLSDRAELHLIGPVELSVREILARHAGESVIVRGALPMTALPAEYTRSDIFCLPSWEEGFPLVLLQAMASGLPIVASVATGAADIVTDNAEGFVVPTGDVMRLADALGTLIDDEAGRRRMGKAARTRVAEGWDWQSYADRAIAHYEKLIAAS